MTCVKSPTELTATVTFGFSRSRSVLTVSEFATKTRLVFMKQFPMILRSAPACTARRTLIASPLPTSADPESTDWVMVSSLLMRSIFGWP